MKLRIKGLVFASVFVQVSLSLASDSVNARHGQLRQSNEAGDSGRAKLASRVSRERHEDDAKIHVSLPESYPDVGPNVKASKSYRPVRRVGLAQDGVNEDGREEISNRQGALNKRASKHEALSPISQPDVLSLIDSENDNKLKSRLTDRLSEIRKRFPKYRSRFGSRLNSSSTDDEEITANVPEAKTAGEVVLEDNGQADKVKSKNGDMYLPEHKSINHRRRTERKPTTPRKSNLARPQRERGNYQGEADGASQPTRSVSTSFTRNTMFKPNFIRTRMKPNFEEIIDDHENENKYHEEFDKKDFDVLKNNDNDQPTSVPQITNGNNFLTRGQSAGNNNEPKIHKVDDHTASEAPSLQMGHRESDANNFDQNKNIENDNNKGTKSDMYWDWEQNQQNNFFENKNDKNDGQHDYEEKSTEQKSPHGEQLNHRDENYHNRNNDHKEKEIENVENVGIYREDLKAFTSNPRDINDRATHPYYAKSPLLHESGSENDDSEHYEDPLEVPDYSISTLPFPRPSGPKGVTSAQPKMYKNTNVLLDQISTGYQKFNQDLEAKKETDKDRTRWAFDPDWISREDFVDIEKSGKLESLSLSPKLSTKEPNVFSEPTKVPGSPHLVRQDHFPYNFWRPSDRTSETGNSEHTKLRKIQQEFKEVPDYLFSVGAGPVSVPEELVKTSYEMVTASPSFDIMSNPFEPEKRFNALPDIEQLEEPHQFAVPNVRRPSQGPFRENRPRGPPTPGRPPFHALRNMLGMENGSRRPTVYQQKMQLPPQVNVNFRNERPLRFDLPDHQLSADVSNVPPSPINNRGYFNGNRQFLSTTTLLPEFVRHKHDGEGVAVGYSSFHNANQVEMKSKNSEQEVSQRNNDLTFRRKPHLLSDVPPQLRAPSPIESHDFKNLDQNLLRPAIKDRNSVSGPPTFRTFDTDERRNFIIEEPQWVKDFSSSIPSNFNRDVKPMNAGIRPVKTDIRQVNPDIGSVNPDFRPQIHDLRTPNSNSRPMKFDAKPRNPHDKYTITRAPELFSTSSHFEVKTFDLVSPQGTNIYPPPVYPGNTEGLHISLPVNEEFYIGGDPPDEQLPSNKFTPLPRIHGSPKRQFVHMEPVKHYTVRIPRPRPQGVNNKRREHPHFKRQESQNNRSIWSALTNFDFSFLNPFRSSNSDHYSIERVASSAVSAIPTSLLVPGGLAALGAGLSLFYFNFVWSPTPVVKARLIDILMNQTHTDALTDAQQRAIGDVTKVYSALSDIIAQFGSDKEESDTTKPLMSQDCKNRIVCQTYHEFEDLLEFTKGATVFFENTLKELDQDLLLEYFLAADRGHHLTGSSTCQAFYPDCALPPVSIRDALRDLAGLPISEKQPLDATSNGIEDSRQAEEEELAEGRAVASETSVLSLRRRK